MSLRTAFCYTQPAVQNNGQIFGVDVAVRNLLSAVAKYGTQKNLPLIAGDDASWQAAQNLVGADNVLQRRRFQTPATDYADLDCIFRPDPEATEILWQRARMAPHGKPYAFCGLVHTVAGREVLGLLQNWLLAPVTAADALICPSRAIADVVRQVWQTQTEYLAHRFGVPHLPDCPVQLPVLPLGIDVAQQQAQQTPQARMTARAALNIAADDIVVLWVGRLSALIKAHPLSMLQAVEQASAARVAQGLSPLVFVLQGYFYPENQADDFKTMAAQMCQSATVIFVESQDARLPQGAWPLGDIFLSLIDNIQESFGLTPLEAMARGLPVVASAWDGYKDTLADTGFLVPVLWPKADAPTSLAASYADGLDSYGLYAGRAAQLAAVDIGAASAAILALANDANLRASRGHAGQARVKALYDWPVVVRQYEALWADMALRARSAAQTITTPPLPLKWPAASLVCHEPVALYGGFATELMGAGCVAQMVQDIETTKKILQHRINMYAAPLILPPAQLVQLLQMLQKKQSSAALAAHLGCAEVQMRHTLLWLAKLGIVTLAS